MLDTRFEFAGYIQKRLKDIDDLDERRFAKELLLENLCKVFTWTESSSFSGFSFSDVPSSGIKS